MTPTTIYPLLFNPILKNYIWGGRNLAHLGRSLPPGNDPVAESWEISGQADGETTVANGPLAGQTLNQVLSKLGSDLVGTRSAAALRSGEFPLLIKLLDCNQPLSVQVHPTEAYAAQLGPPNAPKNEMWYVLHAQPDAKVIFGLNQATTAAEFRAALAENRLHTLLHHLPVQAGQAIMVPTGSVHALLGGMVVAEVQQSANTTYRVYDWGRVDANGQPRELHVEHALQVIDYQQVQPNVFTPKVTATQPLREVISECPFFMVERVILAEGETYMGACSGETFEIWGCLNGLAILTTPTHDMSLIEVQFTLLPATLGKFHITASQPTTLLRVYIPAQNQ